MNIPTIEPLPWDEVRPRIITPEPPPTTEYIGKRRSVDHLGKRLFIVGAIMGLMVGIAIGVGL